MTTTNVDSTLEHFADQTTCVYSPGTVGNATRTLSFTCLDLLVRGMRLLDLSMIWQ